MTIGNGVVRSNSPILLKENGGSLELTEDWVRGVIKSMNWTKRKGTTGKIEPSKQFLLDDKRQITATFIISMSGKFLPIQVIYEGKTKRCSPKYTSPASFDATLFENHWSNTEKSLSFFYNIIFPYFKNVRKAKERNQTITRKMDLQDVGVPSRAH